MATAPKEVIRILTKRPEFAFCPVCRGRLNMPRMGQATLIGDLRVACSRQFQRKGPLCPGVVVIQGLPVPEGAVV